MDSMGNIWTHTDVANSPYNLLKFSPSAETFFSYPLDSLIANYLGVDSENNIWFTSNQWTRSSSIIKLSLTSNIFTQYPAPYSTSIYARTRKVALDTNDNVWFTEYLEDQSGDSPIYPFKIGVVTNFTSTLRIKVQDSGGNPLTGASVTIDGANAEEEGSGFYSLSGLRLGTYTASAKKNRV